MKYLFVAFYSLVWLLGSTIAAQSLRYQLGLGQTSSFLPANHMLIGRVGLAQIPQTTIWMDYNRFIKRSTNHLLWGAAVSVNYEKYWYDIDQPLPYYTPERDWYVFLAAGIKNVELHGYLGKRLQLYSSTQFRLGLLTRVGPVWHINPYPTYTESATGLRNDGSVFRLYVIDFKRPQWYVPYLRGSVSLEVVKRFRSGVELGLSPLLSFAALTQDKSLFTTVPDDMNWRSLGEFSINRGFYGFCLLIGRERR